MRGWSYGHQEPHPTRQETKLLTFVTRMSCDELDWVRARSPVPLSIPNKSGGDAMGKGRIELLRTCKSGRHQRRRASGRREAGKLVESKGMIDIEFVGWLLVEFGR